MPNLCSNYLLVGAHDSHRGELEAFHKLVSTPIEKIKVDYLTGQETQVVENGYFLCDNVFPCPTELRNTDSVFYGDSEKQAQQLAIEEQNLAKYGYKNWYDWCCDKWGTKWGDYDTDYMEHLETPNLRAYRYTTAWSPMVEAIKVFAQKFPNLVFINTYEEGGMAFLGAFGIYQDSMWDVEGQYPEVDWEADDTGFENVEKTMNECVRSVIDEMFNDIDIEFDEKTFDPFLRVTA